MRSNSEASGLAHPSERFNFLMMTEKALFILSPMLWNITMAMGMPRLAYPIVKAKEKQLHFTEQLSLMAILV